MPCLLSDANLCRLLFVVFLLLLLSSACLLFFSQPDLAIGGARGHDQQTQSWFDEHVSKPAASRGVRVELELVRVQNDIERPGPVFTAITKVFPPPPFFRSRSRCVFFFSFASARYIGCFLWPEFD